MHPRGEYDAFAVSKILKVVGRSDSEDFTQLARQCTAEGRLPYQLASLRILLNCRNIVSQVTVGVGHGIGEVNQIIIVFKRISECGGIIAFTVVGDIFPDPVSEVSNILTVLVPADVFVLAFLVTVDRDFHAIVEEGVRLRVVEDIEANLAAGSSVTNLEEEPLSMALSVNVVLHQ